MSSLKIEYHAHTLFSIDSLVTPQALVSACRRKGLNRIVVTDHNTIQGALAAREIAPELVIIGEEIKTQEGELLAAFMTEEIPRGLPAEETIQRLREQNAFISVSHPFDVTRSGHWQYDDLLKIASLVDAIEVFNARCFRQKYNRDAQKFADAHHLLGTVGSDAHGTSELGNATMILPKFSDAVSFKKSLKKARFETSVASPFVRLISRYAIFRKAISNPVPASK